MGLDDEMAQLQESPTPNTPLDTTQPPQSTATPAVQPYTFKDFSTSIPLTEAQAAYVNEIIVVME